MDETKTVLGNSVEGRGILAYHYGEGSDEILFIGGIHGGYAWNSTLVAYELMNYLAANSDVISDNLKITVLPVLNPDGLSKVVDANGEFFAEDVSSSQEKAVEGRFNGNEVDLNRNFACDWKAEAKWQNKTVSGGDSSFSEPESLALKNYVEANNIVAVISLDSAAGGVYASSCGDEVSSEAKELVNLYADASGYTANNDFDSYEITGDMSNWFAKINIPAISVLLTNHDDVEWSKNLAGVKEILEYYAK